MNKGNEVETVVTSKDGRLVVMITKLDDYNNPVPEHEQPPGRFKVVETRGPDPRPIQTCPDHAAAWYWVDNTPGLPPLSDGEISADFLQAAFAATQDENALVSGLPVMPALVEIIGRDGQPVSEQFLHPYVLCKDEEELSILFGEKDFDALLASVNRMGAVLAEEDAPPESTRTIPRGSRPR